MGKTAFPNGITVENGASVSQLTGTVDPSAGAGVVGDIGWTYHRNNGGVGELWLKSGSSATDWTQLGGGSGGGVNVDNGTDPPAAVTTLVAPGADVSTPGTATIVQTRILGPWTVHYNTPNVGSDLVEMADIATGLVVPNAWFFPTTEWLHNNAPTSSSFYLTVGPNPGVTVANYDKVATNLVNREPEAADAASLVFKNIVLTASGSKLWFQGYPDAGTFSQGVADIYLLVATPS